jgi:hypothetical protein
MKTQAIARLKEVAATHKFEVQYKVKDPNGHGTKSGSQIIPAADKESARKQFLLRWKRQKGHSSPVSITKITDRGET